MRSGQAVSRQQYIQVRTQVWLRRTGFSRGAGVGGSSVCRVNILGEKPGRW
jgi:hypothetical protein